MRQFELLSILMIPILNHSVHFLSSNPIFPITPQLIPS
jgi:hypothetical protein